MGANFSCVKCVDDSDCVDNLHKKEKRKKKAKLNKTSSSQDAFMHASQDVTRTSEAEVLSVTVEPGHAEVNDEGSDDAFHDLVGIDSSEWAADGTASLSCVILSVDVPQVPVSTTSAPGLDIADSCVYVPRLPVWEISESSDDLSPVPAWPVLDCSDDVGPASHLKQLEDNEIIDIGSSSYEVVRKIGEGGFGSVYSGIRLEDGLKVALKLADNVANINRIYIEGNPEPIPKEIGLLNLANKGPRVPQIIELLDWVEEPERYIMVLERPTPCEDLVKFLTRHNCIIEENKVKVIMHQASLAAQTCCQRGVLHRDIKLENLLINPDTLDVKLIDFGCGVILTDAGYTSFSGTKAYCPPEYFLFGKYHGKPATVWSLGVLMFTLLCGEFPESEDLDELNDYIWVKDGLSQKCCELLCALLQRNPKKRLELDSVCLHNWFKYFVYLF